MFAPVADGWFLVRFRWDCEPVEWEEEMGKRAVLVVSIAVMVAAAGGVVPVQATEFDANDGNGVSHGADPGSVSFTGGDAGPWVTVAPCPEGVSRPAGAVVDGHFLVIGGESSGGFRYGYVQKYDLGADTWDNSAMTMPIPLSNHCAAVIGDDIYVPGGWDGAVYTSDLQVYHYGSDTWEIIATDPVPYGSSGAACVAYDGKLYAGGGNTGSGYTASFYVYDPAAAAGSRWTAVTPAPIAGGYGDAVTVDGGFFYGGFRDAGDRADVLFYDPMGDTWTAYPNLTTPRGGARMWLYEGNLAVGGGGWSSYFTSVEEYDLSAGMGGVWVPGNALNTGRRTFAAAQDDDTGTLYAGAGYAGAFLTNTELSSVDVGGIFADGFESGDTSAWSSTTP
jgi:hypothetical protein